MRSAVAWRPSASIARPRSGSASTHDGNVWRSATSGIGLRRPMREQSAAEVTAPAEEDRARDGHVEREPEPGHDAFPRDSLHAIDRDLGLWQSAPAKLLYQV